MDTKNRGRLPDRRVFVDDADHSYTVRTFTGNKAVEAIKHAEKAMRLQDVHLSLVQQIGEGAWMWLAVCYPNALASRLVCI